MAVLMPLEIKCHTVPHLKGLINGKNIPGGQERGSTSKILIWKVLILLHTEPIVPNSSSETACLNIIEMCFLSCQLYCRYDISQVFWSIKWTMVYYSMSIYKLSIAPIAILMWWKPTRSIIILAVLWSIFNHFLLVVCWF